MSGDAHSTLPALSPDQAQHSAAVVRGVAAAIAARGGWIPFDEYLRLVLYAPGLGYYSAGSVKFGPAGDFVTAPELSDLFSRCVANQCAPVLETLGGDLLELGAGSGQMAAGVLARLAELGCLPGCYYILEVSAELRARQQAVLASSPPELRSRIVWLERLPARPIDGVVLANEVADALPFRRFAIEAGEALECGLTLSAAGHLAPADRAADSGLRADLARLAPAGWPRHYRSELCPMLGPWIAGLSAALRSGVLLLFDYGLPRPQYYHPERDAGTMRCHFRHRAHDDPLLHPGLQDISAWVDFTRLAEAAADAQLEGAGFCTQAAFLLANGIGRELAPGAAGAGDALEGARRSAQARTLLLPGAMGEPFKVMAMARGHAPPLQGFAVQDLRRSL